jgi:diguanylate cyclase (GGDEF)-like protein/PAS domain S-box-containing protein
MPMPDAADADAAALRDLVAALERFPFLFALNQDAVALYDPDGVIVAGNAASRALVGRRLIGRHFSRHMKPSELERGAAQFGTALSGRPVEFESVFSTRGRPIDVAVSLVPALVDARVVGVFGVARDITARRNAEADRDESRQQFCSLFEQHPDSISMVDTNGCYVRINPAAESVLGHRNADVVGRKVGMVYACDDRDELDRLVLEFTRAGKPSRYERIFVREDGSTPLLEGTAVPIVIDGRVTGIFLLSRDISDRARDQEALTLQARRTAALYRLASEIGADPGDQAGSALAFGLTELGFESAFVVTLAGEILTVERNVGVKVPVDAGDSVFAQLFRETIAASRPLEFDDAALRTRAQTAGAARAFCRAFAGIPLDVESGRYGALGFTSRSAMAPLTDFDREFLRAIAELAAVSIERAVEEKRLQDLAHFDTLTGLPNRLLLGDRFAQALAIARRRGEQVGVYFIDIDKFKAINDTYGHRIGDEVLRTVATRLLGATRASDTVARLGGDEFIVLRSGALDATRAQALAGRLRAELEGPCEIEGLHLKISVGIGISVFPCDGEDEATLLARADAALYLAKAGGAGSIRRFEGEKPPLLGSAPE